MLVCTRYISVQCSTCRYGTIASMYMACTEYIPVCTRYIHSVRIPDEVQAQLCLLFASFASFAPPPRPAWQGLASQWRQWAGPLPARHCTRRILRPAAIHVVTPLFSPSIQRQDQRRNHNCRNCTTACVILQNET